MLATDDKSIARIRIKRPRTILPGLVFGMLASLQVNAQNAQEHHEEHHHHSGEAHVHGMAELLIVLEGNTLDIALHSPAMNLLGFEQQASTPEQRAKVESVRETLAASARLFQIEHNLCQLSGHSVNLSSVTEQHSPPAESRQNAQHSDIEAHYRYQCPQADSVASLSTTILAVFPQIHSLQVQWIVRDRQGSITLHDASDPIDFR